MSGIKDENLLAGSTKKAQDGKGSLPVMKDGEEPPDMLLALLNNVLPSLINSQQAKILAKGMARGLPCTVIVFYGTQPTSENTLALIVGNQNKE